MWLSSILRALDGLLSRHVAYRKQMEKNDNFIPAAYRKASTPDNTAQLESLATAVKAGFARADQALARPLKTEIINHPTAISTPDVKQVVEAVHKLDTSVRNLSLKQPHITVDAPDMSGIKAAINELKDAIKNIEQTEASETISFIDEKFDEYKINFDDFDEDRPISTTYYLDGAQVAKVTFSYNEAGNLIGAKKV